jgi:drug/metabolite transporter (DMT)-like permease
MNLTTPIRAYIALGIGVFILGFSAILIRLANAPGIVSSFYRVAIAVVVMAIPFYRHLRLKPQKISRQGVSIAILAGSLFGIDLAFWSSGIMISGATSPTLMANTAPLWVGLGAMLIFGERQGQLFWLGLFLAMVGATIVLGQDFLQSFQIGIGTMLGLMAAIAYGAYQLATQKGRVNLDTLSFFWISALSSSIVLLLLIAITSEPLFGYRNFTYLIFLILGLVIQVGGWQTINYSQGYVPASLVATTLLGQPVLTALWAALLLGEKLTFGQILGGVAVLVGIYIVHRDRLRLGEL